MHGRESFKLISNLKCLRESVLKRERRECAA